ncbi:peptide transporter [Thermocladium modestius]|uniref:dolichyl-phosphooligosaccharide-protein glycotransferase n=1 Tax=Thermocladium modestius TaxID=62609 RepID=A0A830GTZ6_9CREN|nr:STT3 domain-containing protein [Thermocladium modestius]GGP19127.1 peptide transporter [Thermocladium modestius]
MAKQEAAQVPLLDAELRSSQLFGVAAALVSTLALALYIRLYSVYLWGYYINEFDPYIRYYLTQFMLSLGSVKGIEWWLSGGFINGHPYKFTNFWYPWGINWAIVLSPGVSFTGLLSYDLLKHFHVSLLYTVIMVPGVINALSVLSMYYLGSRIGGKYVGLLSAVLTAYSIIFTQRGSAGWFADSTLFQFVVPLGFGLFIDALRKRDWIPYAVLGAAVNGATAWLWGSFTFIMNVYGLFMIVMLIYGIYRAYKGKVINLGVMGIGVSLERIIYVYLATYLGFVAFLSMTPRYGLHALLTLGAGMSLAALLSVIALPALRLTRAQVRKVAGYGKYVIAVAAAAVVVAAALTGLGIIHLPGGKFLGALLPVARSAIVQSVAEHSPTPFHSFFQTVTLTPPFAATGMAFLLSSFDVAGLLMSLAATAAVYFASSEAWLIMLLGFFWFPLTALGFVVMIRFLIQRRTVAMLALAVFIIALFAVALSQQVAPGVAIAAAPPQIVSTTSPAVPSSDWLDALYWMQMNLPPHASVASWWDYGYWTAIIGNKSSLADNSTVNGTQIAQIGEAFVTRNVTKSLAILRELKAQYVVVFIPYSAVAVPVSSPMAALSIGSTTQQNIDVCGLIPEYPTGGDFVKSYWMALISGHSSSYILNDLLGTADLTQFNTEINVPLSNSTLYQLLFNLNAASLSGQFTGCINQIESNSQLRGNQIFPIPLWFFNTWPYYTTASSPSNQVGIHINVQLEPFAQQYGFNILNSPPAGVNATQWLEGLYGLLYYGNYLSPPPGFQLVYVSRPYGWVLVYKVNYSALNETSKQ